MRPDMNGALGAFDDMVEALEEQEDMVECKECFDLFPKADCTKHEHGYMCPTCNRALEPKPEIDSRMITTDLFDQDFPEVQDYAPGSTREYDKELTVGDALDALLYDEYDAVEGYGAYMTSTFLGIDNFNNKDCVGLFFHELAHDWGPFKISDGLPVRPVIAK